MRKLTWIGIVVLALVILVLGMAGVTRGIFGNRYEAEIAAIKAKGEPVTPAELAGKPVPANENGAVIYKKVFLLLDISHYDAPLKTLDRFGGLTSSDPTQIAEARRALPQVKPILDLVEEATARPECRFPRDWSHGIATLFPEFTSLRRLSRLICSAAVLSARDGTMDESLEYIELGFRHADSLKGEPAIMPLLARQAMMMITSRAMKESLRHGSMSEEQARRLFDILERTDLERMYVRALEGERVSWLSTMSASPGYAAVISAMPDRYQTHSLFEPAAKVLAFGYRGVFDKGDQAVWLQFMAKQIENAGLDYRRARSRGVFQNRTDWPMYALMGELGGESFGDYHYMRFRNECRVATDQVFLALQAYKARYGGYPASMTEMKSKLGWKLPKDPFSEKDFIYKRQAKGFILYSVGPDMKDDGGRSLGDHVELDSKGDIVLRWDR